MQNCKNCGKQFEPRASGRKQIYCSPECRIKNRNDTYNKINNDIRRKAYEIYKEKEMI